SVSQSDGTSVNFTYELVGGEYRVKTVTDASGTTTFAYDLANRRTDITNGLNQQWSYFYDEAGRLVEVRTPPVDGQRLSTRYAYDADGNVLQVTDGRGNAITYGYDANGNRVLERDAQGNTLRRVYGANNELLNEIRYNQPAIWNGSGWTEPPAASAQVVRHAYDGSGRLRYVVSAGGVVSEYRYNAQGQRIRELSYGDANYDLGALAQDATLNTAQLDTWTAARDLTRSTLLELSYDYRGNLRQSTRYAMVTESGTGYMDLAATVTVYIYSERGELLQTIAARSSDTALNS
ncbi:RHS repeat domain-containing protein, partial [Pseudomonas paralcaligenes]|uniref:RHS repeat domain-containing protein n=1 Tax=Pseudomonas paralcaligenes TaxID=2772558 RepID=UPI003570F28C